MKHISLSLLQYTCSSNFLLKSKYKSDKILWKTNYFCMKYITYLGARRMAPNKAAPTHIGK